MSDPHFQSILREVVTQMRRYNKVTVTAENRAVVDSIQRDHEITLLRYDPVETARRGHRMLMEVPIGEPSQVDDSLRVTYAGVAKLPEV